VIFLPNKLSHHYLSNHYSVGKSTVLNALLGDEYCEVSMRRTTAGINIFRLDQTCEEQPKKKQRQSSQASSNRQKMNIRQTPSRVLSSPAQEEAASTVSDVIAYSRSLQSDCNERSAKSTHDEISKDNAALRLTNFIQEKEFDIQLEEPLCEMRDNTQLVLIDIPGVNEADSMSKYKEYVKSKWDTFDCVIVVMDAVQGVNTEEQVDLLRFVKKNNDEQKDIPTIILGNKVDDPEDSEKQLMVQESRDKVVEIFGDGCSEKGVKSVLKAAKDGEGCTEGKAEATFIPISAMHAFLYRKASKLTLERFKALDKTTIDKIGHEEVGRKWRSMSEEEKFSTIQAAVSDPSEYQERLSATNFDNFLSILSYYVGGENVQTHLLKKQLDARLDAISSSECISDQIHSIFNMATAIGVPTKTLKGKFWGYYRKCEDSTFVLFDGNPDPSVLATPLSELLKYQELVKILGMDDEIDHIRSHVKKLLWRQLKVLFGKLAEWDFGDWYVKTLSVEGSSSGKRRSGKDSGKDSGKGSSAGRGSKQTKVTSTAQGRKEKERSRNLKWRHLSPNDWITILESISLSTCDIHFREVFGIEYFKLQRLLVSYQHQYDPTFKGSSCVCSECATDVTEKRGIYLDALRGEDPSRVAGIVQLKMPSSLSNDSHWGHIAWQFCKFCSSIEN
jgi:GTPase SAR1 family protein